MKRKVKKILSVVAIYAVIVVVTLIMANRVEKLENNFELRNDTASVALLDA